MTWWMTARDEEGKKKEEASRDAHDVCRGTSQKWTRDIRVCRYLQPNPLPYPTLSLSLPPSFSHAHPRSPPKVPRPALNAEFPARSGSTWSMCVTHIGDTIGYTYTRAHWRTYMTPFRNSTPTYDDTHAHGHTHIHVSIYTSSRLRPRTTNGEHTRSRCIHTKRLTG